MKRRFVTVLKLRTVRVFVTYRVNLTNGRQPFEIRGEKFKF